MEAYIRASIVVTPVEVGNAKDGTDSSVVAETETTDRDQNTTKQLLSKSQPQATASASASAEEVDDSYRYIPSESQVVLDSCRSEQGATGQGQSGSTTQNGTIMPSYYVQTKLLSPLEYKLLYKIVSQSGRGHTILYTE